MSTPEKQDKRRKQRQKLIKPKPDINRSPERKCEDCGEPLKKKEKLRCKVCYDNQAIDQV
jgi:hypothetical protein